MVFLSALSLAFVAFPGGGLTCRTAQVDLTPTEPLPLGGYTEREGKLSEPGGDRLSARVLVFQQGRTRIAVVSAEMLTIPESLAREVRKRIPSDVHLFLAATHTHCAPDSQMYNDRMTFAVPGIATYRRRRLEEMSGKIASGVLAALRAKSEPATGMEASVAHLARNHTRRAQDYADQALVRLDVRGKPLLWHYAAHPVFYGPEELKTRGDWPGALASATGGLVLLGAIGDVSPDMDKRPPAAQIVDFVEACRAAKGTRLSLIGPGLAWAEVSIELGPKVPHPDFAKTYHVPEALARPAVDKFAPSAASISAFRLGKVAVVGVPGEPTAAVGRRIRDAGRSMGFSVVLVTSHVNGWIGYILEPQDYDRGGYEATLAMHGRDAGERVIEAGTAALKKLARQRRPR